MLAGEGNFLLACCYTSSQDIQQRTYYLLEKMAFPENLQELQTITEKRSVSITKRTVIMESAIEYASTNPEFPGQAASSPSFWLIGDDAVFHYPQ